MKFSRWAAFLRGVMKTPWLKETLLAVPRIALLVTKVMTDERVPRRTKLALAGLAAYLVSPWDLIPDFIPGLGQLDDAIVVLLLVDGVLNQVEQSVLLEHWTGEVATLRRVQKFSRTVSRLAPQELKTYVFGRAMAEGEKRADQSPRKGDSKVKEPA